MNILTEAQQAKINALPREHDPKPYVVTRHFRRRGSRRIQRSHDIYVRATSPARARLYGYFEARTFSSWFWRRKGLILNDVTAREASPQDMGIFA